MAWLNVSLPGWRIPNRTKLLVVVFAAFFAHTVEIALYGLAFFGLMHHVGVGNLSGPASHGLLDCIYFSAETYSSLGYGDVTPGGYLRPLTGVEALNGLLLIG